MRRTVRVLRSAGIGLLVAASFACGARSGDAPRVIGREPPDAVFERALAALERERWDEAIRTLERIPLEYPAYARLQEVKLRTAEAYMGKEEYVTAAGAYIRLAAEHPAGQYADDARFGACEAYRRLSPIPPRDQEYTAAAIDHCEALIANYPASEFVPRAREITTAMREKLAAKVYEAAEFYRRNGAFDSAIIYYDDVLALYPQTTFAPRALLRLVEVYDRIGYTDEASAARERLLRDFPNSPEAAALQQTPPTSGS